MSSSSEKESSFARGSTLGCKELMPSLLELITMLLNETLDTAQLVSSESYGRC